MNLSTVFVDNLSKIIISHLPHDPLPISLDNYQNAYKIHTMYCQRIYTIGYG